MAEITDPWEARPVEAPGRSAQVGALGRRTWLAGVATAWLGASALADGPGPAGPDEERERDAVEARGHRAGLRPFRVGRTGNYQAIGDARDDFRSLTLRDCEAVAAEYLDHYRARGFAVARPSHRLTVVALADDRSFAAFLGSPEPPRTPAREPAPSVHGVYDRASNRLIVFDHRGLGPQLAPRAGHENLRALAHEATHQLTFSTGLLDARGDVPSCISEGLAMYGEVPRSAGRASPGLVNLMRLQDLAHARRRDVPWVPVGDLLADDRHVQGPPGSHGTLLAYAESWLLVYYLMKGSPGPAGFRDYLEAIRGRADPARRLDDARAHLGDLGRLDRDLGRYAVRLQKMM